MSDTGFTLHSMKKRNTFNPIGSEERITGSTQPQGPTFTEDKLDLTGKRGFSKSTVFIGEWEDEEHDSVPRITKTVAVIQYTQNA